MALTTHRLPLPRPEDIEIATLEWKSSPDFPKVSKALEPRNPEKLLILSPGACKHDIIFTLLLDLPDS